MTVYIYIYGSGQPYTFRVGQDRKHIPYMTICALACSAGCILPEQLIRQKYDDDVAKML